MTAKPLRAIGSAPARVYLKWRRVKNRLFTSMLAPAFTHFGSRSTLTPPLGQLTPRGVWIGDGVVLGPGCSLMVDGRPTSQPKIVLHDGVSIAGNCTISAFSSVVLHRDVLLARGVYVSDHSHAYRDSGVAVKKQGVTDISAVVVEEGAWLGQNVVLTPGVTVGRGAVVAANAVVTSDVPAYSLAAGAPARVVRSWDPGTPA